MVSGPSYHKYTDTDWEDFQYTPDYNISEWNILFDGHSHTYYSDGSLSPRQNLLWHMSLGFNAMVLTDHNTFKGVEEIREIARTEYNDSIKVLIGVEWTTERLHLNLIFPPDTEPSDYENTVDFGSYTYTPTDLEIQNLIDEVHSLGGIVVVDHYPWSESFNRNLPTREQLLAWDVDCFEIINEDVFDDISYQLCLNNSLGIITGSDMHSPGAVNSWTTLNVSEFTEEAIFNELKARRTGYIYDAAGSGYDVEHMISISYIVAYPWIKIGQMFKEMYSSEVYGTQLAVFFVYMYLAFFLVEGFRLIKPKIVEKIKKRKG
jgi:predicted metal-dependent phosphoesterase TrpH